MKPMTKFVLAALAATALSPAATLAQDTKNQGYLVDSYGNNITTSSNTGLCWRDSDWTPARAAEPCDPVNKPVATAAPAPQAPVVADAAPAATPAPAPIAPLTQKMSFSADALFAFDKAVLKPEGRQMLDGLVTQLGGTTYSVITATGHTDRFGSNAYNQKLSERRANAVKDYLVSKDILASRIEADGKGESQPITKSGGCTGAKSVKIIACLQPDRRVDVEVQGTKTMTSSR